MTFLPHTPPPEHHRSGGYIPDLECPRCSRHTIVMSHGDRRFSCLSCSWFRDLDHEWRYRKPELPGFIMLLLLAGLVLVAASN